jgi:hypothetical protein
MSSAGTDTNARVHHQRPPLSGNIHHMQDSLGRLCGPASLIVLGMPRDIKLEEISYQRGLSNLETAQLITQLNPLILRYLMACVLLALLYTPDLNSDFNSLKPEVRKHNNQKFSSFPSIRTNYTKR